MAKMDHARIGATTEQVVWSGSQLMLLLPLAAASCRLSWLRLT